MRPHCSEDPAKFRDQFRRRVERGQCFHRPALGCREFAADFAGLDPAEEPILETRDLGLMLFDLRYRGEQGPHEPVFFAARLEQGVVRVPRDLYEERLP